VRISGWGKEISETFHRFNCRLDSLPLTRTAKAIADLRGVWKPRCQSMKRMLADDTFLTTYSTMFTILAALARVSLRGVLPRNGEGL
jgi:hypothetical protein